MLKENPTPEDIAAYRLAQWGRAREVDGLVAYDNFSAIADRVQQMFTPDQRFTVVRHYVGPGHFEIPDVWPSLRLDKAARGGGFTRFENDIQGGFSVLLEHLRGFGFGYFAPEHDRKTEMQQFERLHREARERWDALTDDERRRYEYSATAPVRKYADRAGIGTKWWTGLTHISIKGFAGEPQSSITITYTNEHGVSERTVVALEHEHPVDRATRERAVLERAAQWIDGMDAPMYPEAIAGDLRAIAARNVYHQTTVDQWCGPLDAKAYEDAESQRRHERWEQERRL